MAASSRHPGIIAPAALSFLAIYNPSLGTTDETLEDQIVYYWAKPDDSGTSQNEDDEGEKKNRRLRQIGLAQGMIEFAKAFSNGEAIESIDTEKSRILIHELEPGWWIVASVELTRLFNGSDKKIASVSYSSREVAPQALLSQQLLRGHCTFLLHHAPSLADLYMKLSPSKFRSILERFWNQFLLDWDVLLHGNPAVDIFNALKLAAGGELGIGVGEEEWGSGERDVLEGFISRTDGLVDVVVSRFGDAPEAVVSRSKPQSLRTDNLQSLGNGYGWLRSRCTPRSSDGVVFSGVGSVTRSSLRDISSWMERLCKDGSDTYGVRENPSSVRRRKQKKDGEDVSPPGLMVEAADQIQPHDKCRSTNAPERSKPNVGRVEDARPRIPPPVITLDQETSSDQLLKRGESRTAQQAARNQSPSKQDDTTSSTDTLMKVLTLGVYGSSWGIPTAKHTNDRQSQDTRHNDAITNDDSHPKCESTSGFEKPGSKGIIKNSVTGVVKPQNLSGQGCFLIGLQGDLEQEDLMDDEGDETELPVQGGGEHEQEQWNGRILMRTLHVQRINRRASKSRDSDGPDDELTTTTFNDRLRVVVYAYQPFIFTFLFELQTEVLSLPSFYRSLHHQLGPLQRPLLTSTSPEKVSERLWDASTPTSTTVMNSPQPIYDFVFDPANLTVHTSIPAIPEPGTAAAEGIGSTDLPWTRIESLNVHSQILSTFTSTRRRGSERERTCKTSRAWWVVWMRLPHATASEDADQGKYREAFLIRKASDHVAPTARKSSGIFGNHSNSSGNAWAPGKLAEGIGIDARRYIDGILSLNR